MIDLWKKKSKSKWGNSNGPINVAPFYFVFVFFLTMNCNFKRIERERLWDFWSQSLEKLCTVDKFDIQMMRVLANINDFHLAACTFFRYIHELWIYFYCYCNNIQWIASNQPNKNNTALNRIQLQLKMKWCTYFERIKIENAMNHWK